MAKQADGGLAPMDWAILLGGLGVTLAGVIWWFGGAKAGAPAWPATAAKSWGSSLAGGGAKKK